MTCENCIHYDICNENADGKILELSKAPCFRFKNKDSLVEVVRCKECVSLYDGISDYCCERHTGLAMISPDTFCSYGERK